MSDNFKEQGGAATMDPSPVMRWLTSRVMTRLCQPKRLIKRRASLEKEREKLGQPHVVEYFHQVDDGYSHLAAQVLQPLSERYQIKIVCHIVAGPQGKNSPEPELLLKLSRHDACQVAPEYGWNFHNMISPCLLGLVRTCIEHTCGTGFCWIRRARSRSRSCAVGRRRIDAERACSTVRLCIGYEYR